MKRIKYKTPALCLVSIVKCKTFALIFPNINFRFLFLCFVIYLLTSQIMSFLGNLYGQFSSLNWFVLSFNAFGGRVAIFTNAKSICNFVSLLLFVSLVLF